MGRPVAFTDANVIYAAASRDLLVELAVSKAITLRWSDAVHDEWTTALARSRPDLDPLRIQRTRQLLAQALPDALVADYESLIPGGGASRSRRSPRARRRHQGRVPTHRHLQPRRLSPPTHWLRTAWPPCIPMPSFPGSAPPTPLPSSLPPHARVRLVNPPMSPADYLSALARGALPLTAQALDPFRDQI